MVHTKGYPESRKKGKYGGFHNIPNEEMFVEEQKEHPSFTKKQIHQIVLDHLTKKHGKKAVQEAAREGRL